MLQFLRHRCAAAFLIIASGFVLMTFCLMPTVLIAQEVRFSDSVAQNRQTIGSYFDANRNMTFWVNHVQGRGIGDIMSNTAIGGNQFKFLDNGLRMITAEFQITEYSDPVGSVGVQRRFWLNDFTAAGAGFYYDAMRSFYGNTFQSAGFHFELFRDNWTIRSNLKLPVGQRTQHAITYDVMNTSQPFFLGNNIGVGMQSFRIDETAMRTIDIEIARALFNGEVYAGFHNFDAEVGESSSGPHGGFRGNITPNLATNIGISQDPAFGTNFFGGFTWFFGGGNVAGQTVEEKMTTPVERDKQGVINEVNTQMASSFVPLTAAGQAITFNHVRSGSSGDGTFENPFGSLADADSDADKNDRNVVYLHSGSVFNSDSYALAPNQRFLGEGDNNLHQITTDQLGVITVPDGNGSGLARPIINNSTTGLVVNDRTEVSNVQFDNANIAIQATNLNGNVDLNRTSIANSVQGIQVQGGSGQFTIADVEIRDSNIGLAINNSSSNFVVNDSAFNQVSGIGLAAFNHTGQININRGEFNNGATGVRIIGGTTQLTLQDTTLTDQTATGIDLQNGASTVNIVGASRLAQSTAGSTIQVSGGHAGSVSLQAGSTIVTTNGDGLQFADANGTYEFTGVTTLNGGDAGIDILGNSTGTFTFSTTTITDSTGPGLNIDGGAATVNFGGLSQLSQSSNNSGVAIGGGHSGQVTFGSATRINATNGDGLQFDNANGTYDFRGDVQLNGGDAGIDILGNSTGTFTFSDTHITDPTGNALLVDGGSSNVTFDGLSTINKNNPGSTVRVQGGHSGVIDFRSGTEIEATDGDGLQFENANGQYDFRGAVTLNGVDEGIDISGNSAGTFSFSNTSIIEPSGTAINIVGGSSTVDFVGTSRIFTTNAGSVLNVQGGHTGSVLFGPATNVIATNGDGLQFDNADGSYDFRGVIRLNGGDAGIDIIGGSAGTFTFADSTVITNPTGAAVNIQNLESGGSVNFDGSIESNNDVIVRIDTTAAGSDINFLSTGSNFLSSTDNANGAIFIFDADGDITITTPVTVTRAGFSSLFATDGDGTWTFNDLTIVDQQGLNGGVDIFGNNGTINFDNLNISTDSAGTGDATTGFLAGGNNIINVTGTSNIDADGGAAIAVINTNEINMTFVNVTSNNNTSSQIGFAGDDGIDILGVAAGSLDVTGITTITNADGVAVSMEDTGANVTFNEVAIDGIGLDAFITGVASDSTGTLSVNGGTVNNVGGNGFRIGSTFGTSGNFNLNDTTFTNISGFTGDVANSALSGVGNVDAFFSCNDGGGNTGQILFNGGADSCPN